MGLFQCACVLLLACLLCCCYYLLLQLHSRLQLSTSRPSRDRHTGRGIVGTFISLCEFAVTLTFWAVSTCNIRQAKPNTIIKQPSYVQPNLHQWQLQQRAAAAKLHSKAKKKEPTQPHVCPLWSFAKRKNSDRQGSERYGRLETPLAHSCPGLLLLLILSIFRCCFNRE
jgi:hypothetical protein